jgi:hypothetical protein
MMNCNALVPVDARPNKMSIFSHWKMLLKAPLLTKFPRIETEIVSAAPMRMVVLPGTRLPQL